MTIIMVKLTETLFKLTCCVLNSIIENIFSFIGVQSLVRRDQEYDYIPYLN